MCLVHSRDRVVMLVLMLFVFCAPTQGEIIYVDDDAAGGNDGTSWADAYVYLQDALADASSSDEPAEIRVAQGVYKPDQGQNVTPGDREATFRVISGMTLRGGYAGFGQADPSARDVEAYETILSGDLAGDDLDVSDPCHLLDEASRAENSNNVVTIRGTHEPAVLDGFVITGGNAQRLGPSVGDQRVSGNRVASTPPPPPPVAFGGAGIFSNVGRLVLINCKVTANVTRGYGGGMANVYGDVTLVNCEFDQNCARAGGAMANYVDNISLRNCVFRGNIAGDKHGGAINGNGNLVLTDCAFVLNRSGNDGGAVSTTGDRSDTRFTRCNFRHNMGAARGGAICFASVGVAIAADCTFASNLARNGGAVANGSSRPILTRCIFSGNRATSIGAGASNYGSSPTLAHCTFAGNLAPNGNAVACSSHMGNTSTITMLNCVVSDGGDEIYNGDGSTINVTYSCLKGGWPGEGNIDADPCFVNPGRWDPNGTPEDPNDDFWVDGDYHLESQAGRWDAATDTWVQDDVTSPCVDAGDPMRPVGDEPFPNGGRINIGAYGGTDEASKSYFGGPPCETIIAGDLNGDCKVDHTDFAILAAHWLTNASL